MGFEPTMLYAESLIDSSFDLLDTELITNYNYISHCNIIEIINLGRDLNPRCFYAESLIDSSFDLLDTQLFQLYYITYSKLYYITYSNYNQ